LGSDPFRIVLGLDGNLWFTEDVARAVGRITPSGLVTEFSVLMVGLYGLPSDIAAGADGSLWFTDEPDDGLGRITPAGVVTPVRIPTADDSAIYHPWAITAGPDGNIWFVGSVSIDGGSVFGTCIVSRLTP
jgi:virginiamycin B lyase